MTSAGKSHSHPSMCLKGSERNPSQCEMLRNRLPAAESHGNLQCRCVSTSHLSEKHSEWPKHLSRFFQKVEEGVGEQRAQCVVLGAGGTAHGIPRLVCTADKGMRGCKGCRSPVNGYEANGFNFSSK